jgi:hypothetical protein
VEKTQKHGGLSGGRSPAHAAEMDGPGAAGGDVRERMARRYLAISVLTFVCLFGLVWLYMLTMPMAFMSRDYPRWVAKRTMLAGCDLGSVSILGDSRAFTGIDPRQLPFAASNFAFSGSSPIEGYFALQRLLQCPNRPQAVVIGYSAGQFAGDPYYWSVGAYSGILNFADMQQVRSEGAALHDDEIDALRRGDHLAPLVREAFFAVRFPSVYFSSLVDAFIFGRYAHNRAAALQILADRGHSFMGTAAGSHDVAGEVMYPSFVASPVVNSYFTAMLSALAKDRIPAVIVSLPINDSTCRAMSRALRPGFSRYLRSTIGTFPAARFAGPVMPCWPDQLFGDATHLNAAGAAVYTRLIAQWLKPVLGSGASASRVVER